MSSIAIAVEILWSRISDRVSAGLCTVVQVSRSPHGDVVLYSRPIPPNDELIASVSIDVTTTLEDLQLAVESVLEGVA